MRQSFLLRLLAQPTSTMQTAPSVLLAVQGKCCLGHDWADRDESRSTWVVSLDPADCRFCQEVANHPKRQGSLTAMCSFATTVSLTEMYIEKVAALHPMLPKSPACTWQARTPGRVGWGRRLRTCRGTPGRRPTITAAGRKLALERCCTRVVVSAMRSAPRLPPWLSTCPFTSTRMPCRSASPYPSALTPTSLTDVNATVFRPTAALSRLEQTANPTSTGGVAQKPQIRAQIQAEMNARVRVAPITRV